MLPAALQGRRVLDLGSGSGRDAYMLAQLVGPEGEVVGVDMTDEQLETARSHIDWHMRAFGYARPNVKFLKGYIEKLGELVMSDEAALAARYDRMVAVAGKLGSRKTKDAALIAKVLTEDEAQRIASNIAKLPELLGRQ